MLVYLFVQELRACWRELDSTVEENLSALAGLCGMRMSGPNGSEVYVIPKPNARIQKLFTLATIESPTLLPAGRTNADTKKKLKTRRK